MALLGLLVLLVLMVLLVPLVLLVCLAVLALVVLLLAGKTNLMIYESHALYCTLGNPHQLTLSTVDNFITTCVV